MTYKIAYSGWQVVEVEADTPEAAEEKFWNDDMNDLYNAEIGEIVPADTPFQMYTDLND